MIEGVPTGNATKIWITKAVIILGKSDISAKLCSHYDIKVIEVYENIKLHNDTFQALRASSNV